MKTLWMQPCLYVVSLTIVCVYAAETHEDSTSTFSVHTTLSSTTASSPWNANATDKTRNVTVDNHDTGRGNHSDFITTSKPSSFSSTASHWNANDTDGEPNGNATERNFSSYGLIANAPSTEQSVSLNATNNVTNLPVNTDIINIRANISGIANKTHVSANSTTKKGPTSGIHNVTKAVKKNVTSAANMWLNATDLLHSNSTFAEPMMWLNATDLPHSTSTSVEPMMWLNATDLPHSRPTGAEPKMWLNATDIPHSTSTTVNLENYTRNDTMKDNSTKIEATTTNTSFFWNAYNKFFGSSVTTTPPEITTQSVAVSHNNRTTRSTEGLDARLFGSTHPSSVYNSTAASINENVRPLHNHTRAFNASTSHNAEHKAPPSSPSWSSSDHPPAKKSKSVVGTSYEFSSNLARPWDQQTAMSETHGQNHFNSVVNVNVDSSAESLEKFKHLEAMIMKKMHDMEEMARGLAYDLQWRIDLLDVALGKVINQTVKAELGLKKHIESLINAKSQSLVAGFKNLKCDQNEDLKISTKSIAHSAFNFTTDEPVELRSKPTHSPRTSESEDGIAEWRAKRTRMMERWENNFQRGLQFRRTKRSTRNMS